METGGNNNRKANANFSFPNSSLLHLLLHLWRTAACWGARRWSQKVGWPFGLGWGRGNSHWQLSVNGLAPTSKMEEWVNLTSKWEVDAGELPLWWENECSSLVHKVWMMGYLMFAILYYICFSINLFTAWGDLWAKQWHIDKPESENPVSTSFPPW